MLGPGVRSLRIAALVGALMLAAGACGGGDSDDSSDPPAAGTTSAPTTTTTDPRAEVDAAYLAYWDAYLEAVTEPVNPDLPGLQALMTRDHKRLVTRNLRNMQGSSIAVRERESSRYRNVLETVKIADETASFTACSYDDLITYDVTSGQPVDESVATKWLNGHMVLEGHRWKVAQLEIVRRETGRDQCPA